MAYYECIISYLCIRYYALCMDDFHVQLAQGSQPWRTLLHVVGSTHGEAWTVALISPLRKSLIGWLIVRMTYTSPCVVKLDVSNVSGDIHFDFHILPCVKNNKATSSVRTTVHGSTNMVVTIVIVTSPPQHHHYKELSPSAELTAELLSSSHTLPIFVTLATRFLLIRTFRAARSLWMHCEDQT